MSTVVWLTQAAKPKAEEVADILASI